VLKTNLRLLEALDAEVEAVTRLIASISMEDGRVRLLMTLPGIDYYSAMLILAEAGEVHRFPSARKLASWAGLVPSLHQSGSKAYRDRITKGAAGG